MLSEDSKCSLEFYSNAPIHSSSLDPCKNFEPYGDMMHKREMARMIETLPEYFPQDHPTLTTHGSFYTILTEKTTHYSSHTHALEYYFSGLHSSQYRTTSPDLVAYITGPNIENEL